LTEYTLYLDGRLLVEGHSVHDPLLHTAEMHLEAGRRYPLRLDYVSRGLAPQVRLLWATPGADDVSAALELAENADVIIAVLGLSPRVEGEEMPVDVEGFSGGDRTHIVLPRPQEQLLRQLHSLGKPVVLVLLSGSALALPWAAEHIPAIIQAWYPGQAGGDALADLLFGDCNPGGRLPVTFYRSLDDLPPFVDYRMEGRTYRYFRGEPLFPFGHGLSYTSFAYGRLRIKPSQVLRHGNIAVSTDVRNMGDRAGDEVVQLYVRHRDAPVPRPIQQLKGFQRISLQPRERKTVTFTLHTSQLGYHDEEMRYGVWPGVVELMVGGSSEHLPLRGSVEVSHLPDLTEGRTVFSRVQID
jgi:beta-glucosidase